MVVQHRTCASHLLKIPGPRSLRCHPFLPTAFSSHPAIHFSTTSAALLHTPAAPQGPSIMRTPECSCRMEHEVEAASADSTPPSENSLANPTWLPGNVGYIRHTRQYHLPMVRSIAVRFKKIKHSRCTPTTYLAAYSAHSLHFPCPFSNFLLQVDPFNLFAESGGEVYFSILGHTLRGGSSSMCTCLMRFCKQAGCFRAR